MTASAVFGTEYFVSSSTGSDSADGKSPANAWKTLDRVSAADELAPGDVVRFQCGDVFRGGFKPRSGEPGKPITYTSYGKGLKPSFWRSVSLASESDWIQEGENLWATKPTSIKSLGDAGDFLKGGDWSLHQESGAKVDYSSQTVDGAKVYRFHCEKTGTASNHIQWCKAPFTIEKDVCYRMTFDVKSSKEVDLHASLMMQGSPWSSYGTAALNKIRGTSEGARCFVVFRATRDADDARVTVFMGGIGDDVDIEISNISADRVEIDAFDFGPDVGNIVLDSEKAAFKRWVVKDKVNEKGEVQLPGLNNQDDFCYERSEGRVWFCSKENPAKAHQSLEAAVMRHVVDHSNVRDAIFDGLDIRYGAAHGFGGSGSQRLVIRNCDIAWIGGGDQYAEGAEGRRTRFGNGIEFWSAAEDNLVENCRIWEVYDAAITNQGSGTNVEKNIVYRNNLIWNCEYSFEYWNRDETSVTANVLFTNNICLNAGFGWGHVQRPDRNGRCLMFYSNTAQTTNFVVQNNVFANATESLVRSDKAWEPEGPQLQGNQYWQDGAAFEGDVPPFVQWLGRRMNADEFASVYQKELKNDQDGRIEKFDVQAAIPTDVRK